MKFEIAYEPPVRPIDHRKTGLSVRSARRQAGRSQTWLAEKLGLTPQALCDYEHGRREWTEELFDRVKKLLA